MKLELSEIPNIKVVAQRIDDFNEFLCKNDDYGSRMDSHFAKRLDNIKFEKEVIFDCLLIILGKSLNDNNSEWLKAELEKLPR